MIQQLKRVWKDSLGLITRKGLKISQCFFILCAYYKIVLKRFLNHRVGTFHKESFLGFKVDFNSYDDFFWTFREIFVIGEYHVEVDKTNPVFIDCGGNIGITTLYFKFLYPQAKVLTFEAEPHNAQILESNLKQSNVSDVTVVNKAVGARHDTLTFFGGNRAGTLFEEFNEDKKESQLKKGREDILNKVEVAMVPLSEYIDTDIDVLKIDIEGAEGDVIDELNKKGLLKKVQHIAIEYHRFSFEKNRLSDIISSLEDNHFNIAFDSEYKTSKEWLAKKNHAFMIYASRQNN